METFKMNDSQPEGATELSIDDTAEALMQKWADDPIETPAEEAEEVTEEVEAQAETEPEQSDDQEPESEEEALSFDSVNQLAEALELTPEDFLGQVKGKIKLDGEESEISLSEALNGYQRQADYQRKTAELAETKREFEQAQAQQQAEMQQKAQLAQASLQAAEGVLMQEFQNIDWKELEATDPGQAALYLQKFNQRKSELHYHQNQLLQQYHQEREQVQAQQSQAMQEFLANEHKTLMSVAPDWNDDTSKEVSSYMTSNGFTPEEVSQLVDHRHALLVRKAMLFDKQQKSVDVAKAKVNPLPKVLKPGAKNKSSKANDKIKALKARLKKTGSVQDAAALILERNNVGRR